MKLKCIAIDDEPLALDIIEDYVNKVDFLDYMAGFVNPVEAISHLKTKSIDLLFLDIQMSQLSGLQLIKVLNKENLVILTTAYEKYALKSYELDVVDYLLKPISFERFIIAVNKAYEKKKLSNKNIPNEQVIITNPKESYLFVKSGNKLIKIDFDEILFIEGMSEYLKIVTVQGQVLTLQNFNNLSHILPGNEFVRVHKSYMVSIKMIDNIERNRIKIGEKVIPISDTYKKAFYEILNGKYVL